MSELYYFLGLDHSHLMQLNQEEKCIRGGCISKNTDREIAHDVCGCKFYAEVVIPVSVLS